MTDLPLEPPTAADEAAHLLGALDRQRATFAWKAGGLDAAGLATRVGASSLTLGGLLKHLAVVEDLYSSVRIGGGGFPPPFDTRRWDTDEDWDWPFTSAADDSPEELYALWRGSVDRSRAAIAEVLADGGLDQPARGSGWRGEQPSVRRMLFDLLEEYARHTGHADLLREAVDGVVGEDPPR